MALQSNLVNSANLSQNFTDYQNDEGFHHNYFIYFIFWSRLILSSMGVILNVQVVIVYQSKNQKSPSEYIILNLGVADLLCTLGTTVSTIYDLIESEDNVDESAQKLIKCFQRFSFTAITVYSFLCVFVITLNRFFAVCRPHVYKDMFTRLRTFVVLTLSALISCTMGGLEFAVMFFEPLNKFRRHVTTTNGYIGIFLTVIDIFVMLFGYVCILIKTKQFDLRTEFMRRSACRQAEQPSRRRTDRAPSATFSQLTTNLPTSTACNDNNNSHEALPLRTKSNSRPNNLEVSTARDNNNAQVIRKCTKQQGGDAKVTFSDDQENMNATEETPLDANNELSRPATEDNTSSCGTPDISKPSKSATHKELSSNARGSSGCGTSKDVKSDAQPRRPGQLSALSSRRATNITISLFVISALFIIFTLPYKVLHLRFLLDRSSEPNMFTFEVCLLLFECNFVVNYFVYLYFNSFFRAQLNNFWKVKCTSYQ